MHQLRTAAEGISENREESMWRTDTTVSRITRIVEEQFGTHLCLVGTSITVRDLVTNILDNINEDEVGDAFAFICAHS